MPVEIKLSDGTTLRGNRHAYANELTPREVGKQGLITIDDEHAKDTLLVNPHQVVYLKTLAL